MPNPLSRIPLPAWAQIDHPVVQRELDALPDFLGQDGNLNVKMLLLALVGLGLVSCSCTCGGVGWPLLKAALGLVPLLWGAMLVNRDQAARRWDLLRVTPYSLRDILLAKMTAALYRLSPLLALLLAGEALSALMLNWFVTLAYTSAWINASGTMTPLSDVLPPAQGGFLMVWAVALAQALFSTLLGFVLSLGVGLLASTLTSSRGWAFAGAVGLRVVLTAALAGGGLLLTQGLAGGEDGLLTWEGLGQAASGLGLGPVAPVLQTALLALLGLLGQGLALIGVFRLAEWRAAR